MMADQDFDSEALARYLHLTVQQIERLASRGQVPARRVGGKWRYSPGEIHHWMEQRMGLLEDEELAQVEGALAHADNLELHELFISKMVHPEGISVALVGRTKNSIIHEMTQLGAATGLLWDPEKMAEAVRIREQLQSTAMENGAALLHPRRPLANVMSEPIVAIGIAPHGIPFGGSSRLTDIFFLIASCDDRGHLRTLARLSRLIGSDEFLAQLRSAPDAHTIHQIVTAAEEGLD
jgi:PTS system nitrogen regulatory IIA component